MAPPQPHDAPEAAGRRPGDRLAARRAQQKRRSALVRVLRLLTPLAMAAIAAVLVGWIIGRANRRERAENSREPVSIHMSNPRFIGQDARGRPFVLTGTSAVRDTKDTHLVAIHTPHLELGAAPEPPFVVVSREGLYRDDTHRLHMTGDVVVDDGHGNRFYSDEGEVDTDSGDVTGRSQVRGEGPTGTIRSDSYALSDKGDHATFTGRVKSHLTNASKGPAPATKRP